MKKSLLVALISAVPLTAISQAATVNLNTWTAQNQVPGAGNWNVAPGGGSVLQSINGEPTVFLSPLSALGTGVEGRIRVGNDGDNDFIGFVLGFDNGDFGDASADYLLIDWKQGDQNFGGRFAEAGLAVSRVTGPLTNALDLWDHSGVAEELARGTTLGSTGWADNVEYAFDFAFTSTNLRVWVDDVLQIDLDGNFSDGNLGFYNYSQSSVTYSGFTQDVLPPQGVPDGGAGLLLTSVTLGGLVMAHRVNRRRKA